jgi:hypothetical protein
MAHNPLPKLNDLCRSVSLGVHCDKRKEKDRLFVGECLNRHINGRKWAIFGQKRRKVGRLQRQAARCFLVTQEASSVELGTWCWPRVALIEKRPLTESERSSMNRAARSFGARRIRRLGRNNWIWRLSDDVAARWR